MMVILNFLMLLASSGEDSGGLLDVNPGLIFWTVITFILLLLILKKMAWKPILSSLNERENFIKESVERAETAKKESEEILEQNKKNWQVQTTERRKQYNRRIPRRSQIELYDLPIRHDRQKDQVF